MQYTNTETRLTVCTYFIVFDGFVCLCMCCVAGELENVCADLFRLAAQRALTAALATPLPPAPPSSVASLATASGTTSAHAGVDAKNVRSNADDADVDDDDDYGDDDGDVDVDVCYDGDADHDVCCYDDDPDDGD